MKAYLANLPENGVITDIKIQMPAPDEVLIEVKAVGVCGTDVHIYNGEYL